MNPIPELQPGNRGRLEQARRLAAARFDAWNDIAGFVVPHTGYYYELQALLEDAAEAGFAVAYGASTSEIIKNLDARP